MILPMLVGVTLMPRKLPDYVECNRVKGHVYFSFRRNKGPRIRLPDDLNSLDFQDAYAAALAGNVAAKRERRPSEQPGTIAALITSYKGTLKYATVKPSTKIAYSRRLDILKEKHGHRSLAGLTPDRIEKAILLPYVDRPGEALNLLKLLRILIKHGRKLRWLRDDPSVGIERPVSQEIRSWTDSEIAVFEARWPIGTKQRLAFSLHLYTAQRRSDVHRMVWSDIGDGTIRVVQQKGGAKLDIALHRDLRTVLGAAKRQHVSLLVTEFGRPFTVNGFSRFMRDAIDAAGLPLACQPHGLRKSAGRRLAEAGCTPH
jgi:integrase